MPEDHSIINAQKLSYGFVRERILNGTYRGGTLLKPHLIAEQLGISRMPVREALRQLDSEGLVTLRLNRSAVVTTLTISEITDLFDMRAALEALTAPSVVANTTNAVLDELEEIRLGMDAVRVEPAQWIRRHDDFHDCLLRLCDRKRLVAEIARFRASIQPYLLLYIDLFRHTEMPGHEHETVVSALRTRNVRLVEMCLHEHVVNAGRGLVRFLSEQEPAAEDSHEPRRGGENVVEGRA
jgi:DNA-binding GntR family transcriptional regulator